MTDEQRGFQINGRTYEVPAVASFDNDEARIFYDTTGHTMEQLWLGEITYADLFREEGFLPAMAHIAYRREHPDADQAEVKALIGKQNRLELLGALLRGNDGEEEDPKAERATSAPPESSPSSSSENETSKPPTTERSGSTSESSTDEPDDGPATTGMSGSDSQPGVRRLRQAG